MNKKVLLTLAFLLGAASAIQAQGLSVCNTATVPVCTIGSAAGLVQIKPQAVPNSAAATVATVDAYLITLTVTNTSGGAVTFTLADKQAAPIALCSALSIAANATQTFSFPTGYWLPGGFTVQAGGTGLTYYASWKQ